MKLKFKNQTFQQLAVDAVAELFLGQERQQFTLWLEFANDTAMSNAHYNLQDRGIEITLV